MAEERIRIAHITSTYGDGGKIGLGLHSVSQGLFAIADAIRTLAPQDIPPVEREYNPYKGFENGMD